MDEPVIDIEGTLGSALTYNFATEGADDRFYTLMTSTLGWNFDRNSMTSVVYDVTDPAFIKTPDSSYNLTVGKQTQLVWEITESFGGTYDLKLNDTTYLDYSGPFISEYISFFFKGETIGEYVFTMDLSDAMGHTTTNTDIINVAEEEKEKPKIGGFLVGFMMVAAISTILYIVKKYRRS